MRGVLHKWTTWDKYFKYLKFSATLECFSLFLECFGEICFLCEPSEVLLEYLSAKWCARFCFSIFKDRSFHCDVCNVCLDKRLEGRHSCWENSGHDGCCNCIYIPYKFALSSCIPSKIKCEILAHKGLQTIHAMPGDYLASWNCKPMGQPDLLVSMTMNQDFPGKVTHCRKVFFYPDCSEEHWGGWRNNKQSYQRQRQNLRPKWKNHKMCWGAKQRIDRKHSKLRFEVIVDVFVSRLVLT